MRILVSGRLEIVLAALLGAICISVGWQFGTPLAVARDLAASLAAGCVARWPRTATVALAAILTTYLLTPRDWVTFGEYAALIPVLSAGMHGRHRERWVTTVGYLAILTALQYHDYPGELLVLYGGLVWAVLFAGMWLIGDVFTALRRAQQAAAQLALTEQRMALARDLHDTVMRTLTRLTLRAQLAEAESDISALRPVAEGMRQAASELRWMLSLLRAGDPVELGASAPDSLHNHLQAMVSNLARQGFFATLTVEGDLNGLPASVARILAPVIDEAEANIERHASRQSNCAIIASVGETLLDVVFINEVGSNKGPPLARSLGLIGARERLAPVGGELSARQEGKQWVTRIVVPVPETPR